MKQLSLLALVIMLIACEKPIKKYTSEAEYPIYPDADLWTDYTPEKTVFKLWSPPAEAVKILFYENGMDGNALEEKSMSQTEEGLWQIAVNGDLAGKFYTYQVQFNGSWLAETPGIYAQAVGVNGYRAMVVNMKATDPQGWETDNQVNLGKPNEAVIYELHIRDMTIQPDAGSGFPGKYLGLTETGTKGPEGIATGIDHLKELGITHVHLLPAFDHYSVDETRLDSPQFNWGYDPHNYNVPEGSFSTNPYDGATRIREFKQMVKALHDAGIGVILDVVYNHTGRTENSNFNLEVPNYYYRLNADGSYSNASACGNETASEKPMMRKFIKESVLHWAREYHIDGFRFDLMGIHDMATMNELSAALKAVSPSIFVYGEGWTAGGSPLPDEHKALKKNTFHMAQVSAFSDDLRDGIKGSVFDDKSTGFVTGANDTEESIKFGVVGSIAHPEVDLVAVNYSDTSWANDPWQAISYVSCHDNHTLYDKLKISRPDASAESIIRMQKLANGIVLTSQGVAFLHAGSEMMRTKSGEHNSYNLPDSINQMDWNWKNQNREVFDYYKDLIALRKKHPAFYMPTGDMVRKHLHFIQTAPGLIGYQISDHANGDSWSDVLVYYNAREDDQTIQLEGEWQLAAMGGKIDEAGWTTISGQISIPKQSLLIAFKK